MKLAIIPEDGTVYKNGASFTNINLSSIPSNVHALQWDGTKGWIEFVPNEDSVKPENEFIEALPIWAEHALQMWDQAKAEEEQNHQAYLKLLEEGNTPLPADEHTNQGGL